MGSTQMMQHCASCARPTLHVQKTPNHVLHLLLSVFTLGVWVPVWIIVSLTKQKPRCTICGSDSTVSAAEQWKAAAQDSRTRKRGVLDYALFGAAALLVLGLVAMFLA